MKRRKFFLSLGLAVSASMAGFLRPFVFLNNPAEATKYSQQIPFNEDESIVFKYMNEMGMLRVSDSDLGRGLNS
jgi:hypothetical protein